MPPLLELQDLRISFPAPSGGSRPALHGLNLHIDRGEILGLVGESGSGKSLTSLAIMGLLPPSAKVEGRITYQAKSGTAELLTLPQEQLRALRGSEVSMIFQEPMTALNPVMRVGPQIAEGIRAHRAATRREADALAIEALKEVAITEPDKRAHSYPHQLSGGMRQRVMCAMAIVNRPQLLIADEPTTALDVTIQAQILKLLLDLRAQLGLTMLFISHDLAVISQVADRVAVLYAGQLVEVGPARDIFAAPAHPYTRGLLQSAPSLNSDRSAPLKTIEGSVPSAARYPSGCPFHPRCSFAIETCRVTLPPLVEVSPSHSARCPVVNPPS